MESDCFSTNTALSAGRKLQQHIPGGCTTNPQGLLGAPQAKLTELLKNRTPLSTHK